MHHCVKWKGLPFQESPKSSDEWLDKMRVTTIRKIIKWCSLWAVPQNDFSSALFTSIGGVNLYRGSTYSPVYTVQSILNNLAYITSTLCHWCRWQSTMQGPYEPIACRVICDWLCMHVTMAELSKSNSALNLQRASCTVCSPLSIGMRGNSFLIVYLLLCEPFISKKLIKAYHCIFTVPFDLTQPDDTHQN